MLELRISLLRVPSDDSAVSKLLASLSVPFSVDTTSNNRNSSSSDIRPVGATTAVAAVVVSGGVTESSAEGGAAAPGMLLPGEKATLINDFNKWISTERCLEGECCFARVFDEVLSLCARVKVDCLTARIRSSISSGRSSMSEEV